MGNEKCIVCGRMRADWLVCEDCKGNVLNDRDFKICRKCEHAEEPRKDHPPDDKIDWVYCTKHGYDIADYLYCEEFDER